MLFLFLKCFKFIRKIAMFLVSNLFESIFLLPISGLKRFRHFVEKMWPSANRNIFILLFFIYKHVTYWWGQRALMCECIKTVSGCTNEHPHNIKYNSPVQSLAIWHVYKCHRFIQMLSPLWICIFVKLYWRKQSIQIHVIINIYL